MLSTHAPLFIDPLQDHTTIVRLSRNQSNPTPSTYRAEEVGFSADERENLKLLNRFDQGLAEMFFGQHPLLIEGDTEFALFEAIMNSDPEGFPMVSRPTLVRARGKQTLALIIRMLRHFKVPFSVLHDSDPPCRIDGSVNPAWTANHTIYMEIQAARQAGIRVVHRVSIPTFELAHLPVEVDEQSRAKFPSDKEKPWKMLSALRSSDDVQRSVRRVLEDLLPGNSDDAPFRGEYSAELRATVDAWAQAHSRDDPRFRG